MRFMGSHLMKTPMRRERRTSTAGVLAWAAGISVVGSSVPSASAADGPDDRDHAKPCRPTITCTADITAPGEFEIEAGSAYAHGDALSQWAFPFLLKLSVADWLQAQLGSNGYTLVRTDPHADFMDNIFVGPKFHLVDQGSIAPSLAFSAQVSVPTFAADGYVKSTDVFFVGYASKDLGPVHADWNAGLSVWRVAGGAIAQGYTSVVFSTTLPASFGAALEGYVFSDAAPAASRDGGLRGAATFSARPWLVIDAGGDAGLYPSVRGYTLFAGVTVIPVVFWRSANHRPAD
jgi:hypothetical protein